MDHKKASWVKRGFLVLRKMAGMVGLEPTTNRLTVYCANQLRHIPVILSK